MKVIASELKLGDVIKAFDGTFNAAVVKNIEEEWVSLFRPFVHTSDYSHSGGISCYIGIEEWKVWKANTHAEYEILETDKKFR